MKSLKKWLLTGLLIWLPFAITLWVLSSIISTMDSMVNWLPSALQPTRWFGMAIPGSGLVLALLVVLVTGFLAANILGQKVVQLWDALLGRIPVVKTIYNSVKQVSDTLLSGSGQAFSKALLIRFPHQDIWTIAFLTGTPSKQVAEHLDEDFVSVYVPTTPNPTGGYFLLVPKSATRELDMSVDDALKYIISMGVVSPSKSIKPIKPSLPH
jgi:uncharacterized membrane protein